VLHPRPRVDPVDAVDLARLVAARHGRLRVARRCGGELTNTYDEQRWDGQTAPTDPYAVYLADRTGYRSLAFDLDASRGDVGADAVLLRRLLTESGVRFIEARSGPQGGRHVIATFRDPLPAAKVAALARHLGHGLPTLDVTPLCNPATGAIRPPGSPHRDGGTSTLLTPSAIAVSALTEGNTRAAFSRLYGRAGVPARAARRRPPRPTKKPRPLSPYILRLQRDGDLDGRWPDRSGPAAAVCLGYVEAGRPFAEFLQAALDPANRGLDHLRHARVNPGRYRRRSQAESRAAAERMWRGRIRYAEQHPARPPAGGGDLDAHIAAVLAAAAATPARWAGQAGPSDLAALRAVAHLVATRRAPTVSAATRTISELTGRTQSTADRALRRLTRDGWLIRVTAGRGTDAATYRLATPDQQPTQPGSTSLAGTPVAGGSLTPAPPTTDRLCTAIAIQGHDVMTNDGLGRYAAAVHIALCAQPGTVADLASRTGLTSRTVRRQLRRLATAGIAHRTERIWAAADVTELDRAADQLGVTGAVARRAAAHAAERATWRWWLADFTARGSWTVERGLWLPGRHTLTTGDRHVPSQPFPRRAGRAAHTHALRLVLDGQGPTEDSVSRALTPPPSSMTTSADRCPASRRLDRLGPRPSSAPPSWRRRAPNATAAARTSRAPGGPSTRGASGPTPEDTPTRHSSIIATAAPALRPAPG
jgi:predicted transcriptional regulator